MDKHVMVGVLMEGDQASFSFKQTCETYHIPEEFVLELLDHGFLDTKISSIQSLQFDFQTIQRIRSAHRLQHDLGINLPGVVLALELLEELEAVKNELGILRRHVK